MCTSLHEGSEETAGFRFVETQVKVQEEEKLSFHKINLGDLKILCVNGPVFIFRRRVMQVLGGDNQGSEKDAVAGTWNTCGGFIIRSVVYSEVMTRTLRHRG